MTRARSAVKTAGAAAVELIGKIETTVGGISIGTTHRADVRNSVLLPLWLR